MLFLASGYILKIIIVEVGTTDISAPSCSTSLFVFWRHRWHVGHTRRYRKLEMSYFIATFECILGTSMACWSCVTTSAWSKCRIWAPIPPFLALHKLRWMSLPTPAIHLSVRHDILSNDTFVPRARSRFKKKFFMLCGWICGEFCAHERFG